MSKKIAVTAIDQVFAEGTTPAGIKITVINTVGAEAIPASIVPNEPFELALPDDLPAGDYTVTAQAVDTAGTPLGASVSNTFTVTTVTVKVPQSVAVVTA